MPNGTASFLASFAMAQPAYIELQTGTDRFYTLAVWCAWLTSAAGALMHSGLLTWPIRAAAFGLLILLWPGIRHPLQRPRRLWLGRDGKAVLGDQAGTWGRYARSCRWYVILGIDLPRHRERVLLSASRNDINEYRKLLIWVRLAPGKQGVESGFWRQA